MTDATCTAPEGAPIDCRTAVRRLWDYLDGRLPAPQAHEVAAHLAACAGCPPHFAFAASVQRALAASAAAAGARDADDDALRTRVRAALHRDAGSGGR